MIEIMNKASLEDIVKNNLLYSSSDKAQEINLDKNIFNLKNSQDITIESGNSLKLEKLNNFILKLDDSYIGCNINTKEIIDTNVEFISGDEEALTITKFYTDETTISSANNWKIKTFSAFFNYQRTNPNVIDGFLDFSSVTIVEDIGWSHYDTKYVLQLDIYIDGQPTGSSQYHYKYYNRDRDEDNEYPNSYSVYNNPYLYKDYLMDGKIHEIELRGTLYQNVIEDKSTDLYLSFDGKYSDEAEYKNCHLTVYEFLKGNHQINPSDT